jgi:hypothetical protein
MFPSTSPSIPAFQRKLPIIPVLMLGSFELICGLFVLILEILVFDIAIGVWCGFIFALAGVAAIVFGILNECSTYFEY